MEGKDWYMVVRRTKAKIYTCKVRKSVEDGSDITYEKEQKDIPKTKKDLKCIYLPIRRTIEMLNTEH